MPADSLTAEQQRAVDTRNVSVALSAGAGCGKTHVLTSRFLSHLAPVRAGHSKKPARLHQLIAITFTDAAAREMRSRIRAACRARLQAESLSPREADEWLRLLRQIDTARISTIHAFCSSLLRKHAVTAGLDPAFGVVEQGEAAVLRSDVIDDVLRQRLADGDDATLDLAAAYGLSQLKRQLYELMPARNERGFADWLTRSPAEAVQRWRDVFTLETWPDAVRQINNDAPVAALLDLLAAVAIDEQAKPKFAAARAGLSQLLPQLESGAATAEQLETILALARVQSICSAKDWPTKQDYDAYKTCCERLRKCIEHTAPTPFNSDAALETGAWASSC